MDHYVGFRPPLTFEASVAQEQRTSHEFSWLLPQIPPLSSQSRSNAISNYSNRPTSDYFKTRLCDRFQYDCCPNGDKCNFAHGIEELRRPLGGQFARQDQGAWTKQVHIPSKEGIYLGDERKLQKHKVCRKFHSGEVCPYGDKCSFAHVEPGSLQDSTRGGYVANHNFLYWKTKLCHKFSTSGHCPYGDQCNYAHGEEELRKTGGDHVNNKGKDVEAGAPKIATSYVFDEDVLPKTKAEPVSVPQVQPKKVRTLTLEMSKRIYGDWIDD